jgi:hypothetical protein
MVPHHLDQLVGGHRRQKAAKGALRQLVVLDSLASYLVNRLHDIFKRVEINYRGQDLALVLSGSARMAPTYLPESAAALMSGSRVWGVTMLEMAYVSSQVGWGAIMPPKFCMKEPGAKNALLINRVRMYPPTSAFALKW